MERRAGFIRPHQRMIESPLPLVSNLGRILTERGDRVMTFAKKAGMDRSLLWRIAVGQITNPGLRATAMILVSLGEEEAYKILVESAMQDSVLANGEEIFPGDAKVAEGTFSEQLREYRLKRGYSLRELEESAKLAKDSVIRFESGKAAPRLRKLSSTVVALGLNPKQAFNLLQTAANDESLFRRTSEAA